MRRKPPGLLRAVFVSGSYFHPLHSGRWRADAAPLNETVKRGLLSDCVDRNRSVGIIARDGHDAEFPRLLHGSEPKADVLHPAMDFDMKLFHEKSSQYDEWRLKKK